MIYQVRDNMYLAREVKEQDYILKSHAVSNSIRGDRIRKKRIFNDEREVSPQRN